jgi:hypothetical protein
MWLALSVSNCVFLVTVALFVRMPIRLRAMGLFLAYFAVLLMTTSLILSLDRTIAYFDWDTWLFVIVLPIFIFAYVGACIRYQKIKVERHALLERGTLSGSPRMCRWMSNFYDVDLPQLGSKRGDSDVCSHVYRAVAHGSGRGKIQPSSANTQLVE